MYIEPTYILSSGGVRSYDHNVRYLCYLSGDTCKAIRVAKRVKGRAFGPRLHTVHEAIHSLKTSVVLKAEDKGYTVTPDWENEEFIVQAPRRKNPRKVPFKMFSRKRSN